MNRLLPTAAMLALLVTAGHTDAEVVGHSDPLSLLASNDPALAANKRVAFDVWRGIVNGGHVELADDLLADTYTQHSPVLPTGREAFKQIFSSVPRSEEIPALVSPPLVALVAEGPYVVMAMVENLNEPDGSGPYTSTHFNLFRVADGRLAEHWHSVQTAPGPTVAPPDQGGPQPVTGQSGRDQLPLLAAQDPALAANKRLVFDMTRQVIDAGREELTELYLAADYIERSPVVAPGRNGFIATIAAKPDLPIEIATRAPLVAVVAESDLVVLVTMQEHPHPSRAGATYTTTLFDMYRIADERIIEHWDGAVKPGTVTPF
jgi:predicted SnoaL-like aldol condensation-catalyzing enzyme